LVGWLSGVARLLWATARCRATGQPDRELAAAEQFVLQSFPPVRKKINMFQGKEKFFLNLLYAN